MIMFRLIFLVLIVLSLGGCELVIGHLLDRWSPVRPRYEPAPPAPAFDPRGYKSISDCLDAAYLAHADLNLCTPLRTTVRRY